MKGFFITATDTGVGKTIITGGLAGALRQRGYSLGVYKPAQSGHLVQHPEGDAARLKGLSGVEDLLEHICPYAVEEPLAPLLALRRAGRSITMKDLEEGLHQVQEKHEWVLVEGAGGLAVPYVEDGLVVDVAVQFTMPLIIVARPNLGTINHTLLTIAYARQHGLQVAGVVISGYEEKEAGIVEQTNPGLIEEYSGVPVLGVVPWIYDLSREKVISTIQQSIRWELLGL